MNFKVEQSKNASSDKVFIEFCFREQPCPSGLVVKFGIKTAKFSGGVRKGIQP